MPSKDNRPRIWSDGSQNPPFELRTFALASVRLARDSLSGLLGRCSASARDFGGAVAAGRWRVPPERLGRSGRFLPPVAAVAATIRTGAEVLSRAARVVVADAEQEEASTPTPPQDISAWRAPRRVEGGARSSDAVLAAPSADRDLAAIRAILRAEEPPRPAPLVAPVVAAATETTAPRPARLRDWLTGKAALVLGYGLLVITVPVGIALAALAHLSGKDLRKLLPED